MFRQPGNAAFAAAIAFSACRTVATAQDHCRDFRRTVAVPLDHYGDRQRNSHREQSRQWQHPNRMNARQATGAELQAARPRFLRCTSSSDTAAGVKPGIRAA